MAFPKLDKNVSYHGKGLVPSLQQQICGQPPVLRPVATSPAPEMCWDHESRANYQGGYWPQTSSCTPKLRNLQYPSKKMPQRLGLMFCLGQREGATVRNLCRIALRRDFTAISDFVQSETLG